MMMTNLLLAVVTAYVWTGSPCANGSWPVAGVTCAGPRWVPLGTRVCIEGVGIRTVTDRTALRFDGRFDVFMDSRKAAIRFGKQTLKVKILEMKGK